MINLIQVLREAKKSMKVNKTFTFRGKFEFENQQTFISTSFTGNSLFLRIEGNYFQNLVFNLETFKLTQIKGSGVSYIKFWDLDAKILKILKSFAAFKKASFNPEIMIVKMARKLKVKNYTLESSDRSASTYLKNPKGETVLRVADHNINVGLVLSHGHSLPKFNIMLDEQGKEYNHFMVGGSGSWIDFTRNF
jgi:hypothetical protein